MREYFDSLPGERKRRLESIRDAFQTAQPGAELTMKYRMPTFEWNGNWASLGNQKHHLSVYFCSEDIIAPLVAKHPSLNCGKGCVRIRDTQEVPLHDLVAAFERAMSGATKRRH